jgi:predicted nicotinamide N-methyase
VVGLVAARRGAAVTLTDANEEAVAAAARNARLNGIDARCARFDWNDEPDAAWDHDVLIGCDVLYAEASAGAIGRLIDRLSCVALLGCPARAGSEGVGDRLREAGLRVWETSMAGGRLLVAQRAGA